MLAKEQKVKHPKLVESYEPVADVPPPLPPSSPPSQTPPSSGNSRTTGLATMRWLLATILLLIGGIVAVWVARQPIQSLLELLRDQEAVSTYLKEFGSWGPLVLAVVQLLQVMVAVIPGHVFLVAAGYVYGFWSGFVLNLVYVVIASQLAFVLARWAGRPLVERLVPEDILVRWYRIGEEQGLVFFTIAFLLPVFPTDMMNFIGGLTGISARRFLAANILGRLPGVIILTLIGSHGLEMTSLAWGIIAGIVASFYIIGRYTIIKIERRYHHLKTLPKE